MATIQDQSIAAADRPTPPPAPGWPFAYGETTTANPWETVLPAYAEGPDILYADAVLHAGHPAWVPRRVADLREIYKDGEHFSNDGVAPFAALLGESWQVLPQEADQPLHGLIRKAINPAFTPKAVAVLDEKMRAKARQYVADVRDRGGCDYVRDFALQFPIRVFLDLMGMPQSDCAQFLAWEDGLLHSPDLETLRTASRAVVDYLTDAIEARKQAPGNDLISHAVLAQGGAEGGLSDQELLGVCFNLFIGGLDSVATNMAWQVFHLATHVEDQRRLRADPSLIPAAIDEMQRYYAAITTYRRCVKPYEVAGITIRPGEFVALSTTVAGRDDREFEAPNEVRLDRRPRHVTFGHGPHLCLGNNLARREMKIALEEVLAGWPEFRLREGAVIETLMHSTIQPQSLPIEW